MTNLAGELDRREEFVYDDETGDLHQVRTFNKHNVLVREETTFREEGTGLVTARVTPEGTLSYQYDDFGRLAGITSSTGLETRYSYDKLGRLAGVTDPGLSPSGEADATVRTNYDALGRKKKIDYPNGAKAEYAYNDAQGGWVAGITHTGTAGELLNLTYTRDAGGLITAIAERRPDGDRTFSYGYDGLKRLTSAEQIAGSATTTTTYAYDRRGNRLTKTVGATVHASTYNALDQLVAEATNSTPTKTYTWDSLGRMTAMDNATVASNSQTYAWSGDDQLLQVTQGFGTGITKLSYSYDSSGTRVARSALEGDGDTDPDETRYLADYENLTGYSQVLAETGETENALRNYIYGQDHAPLAQRDATTGPSFFHGDHLGTTRSLTNATGIGSGVQDYDPFGALENSAGSSLTSQLYTGQFREQGTELQWHRARWLNTDQGRWLSEDPVFDQEGNFGNEFLYSGAGGPSTYDPLGTFTLLEALGVLGIVSLLVRLATFTIDTIQQAYGIELISQEYVDAIYQTLDMIDLITIVVSIPSFFKSLPAFFSLGKSVVGKVGSGIQWMKGGIGSALQYLGTLYRSIFKGGSFLSQITVKGLKTPIEAGKLLRHLPSLDNVPNDLHELIMLIQKLTNQARELIASKDWTNIDSLYGHLPRVKYFTNLMQNSPNAKNRFASAGSAIEAIVREELEIAARTSQKAFGNITLGYSETVLPAQNLTGGVADITLHADSGIFHLDITSSTVDPKAVARYGNDSLDIFYDTLGGGSI